MCISDMYLDLTLPCYDTNTMFVLITEDISRMLAVTRKKRGGGAHSLTHSLRVGKRRSQSLTHSHTVTCFFHLPPESNLPLPTSRLPPPTSQ